MAICRPSSDCLNLDRFSPPPQTLPSLGEGRVGSSEWIDAPWASFRFYEPYSIDTWRGGRRGLPAVELQLRCLPAGMERRPTRQTAHPGEYRGDDQARRAVVTC